MVREVVFEGESQLNDSELKVGASGTPLLLTTRHLPNITTNSRSSQARGRCRDHSHET